MGSSGIKKVYVLRTEAWGNRNTSIGQAPRVHPYR